MPDSTPKSLRETVAFQVPSPWFASWYQRTPAASFSWHSSATATEETPFVQLTLDATMSKAPDASSSRLASTTPPWMTVASVVPSLERPK